MTKPKDELVDRLGDGFIGMGAQASYPEIPRWVSVANVPDRELPPIPQLACRRTTGEISVDGALSEPDWDEADWSPVFGHISDGVEASPSTRVALLWDDEALYAGYRVEDPDIRAAMTRHHEHVYVKDDDVELFVSGAGNYYELGLNPINTIYEIGWTWLEQLVEAQDFERLEELLKIDDQLYYAARPGERLGRLGDLGWELPGLRHVVRIDGAINAPDVRDNGWTVEVALPWAGLATLIPELSSRPEAGTEIVIQAYRAHHPHDDAVADADIARLWSGATAYHGTTLSAMGNTNVHNPERWVRMRLEG